MSWLVAASAQRDDCWPENWIVMGTNPSKRMGFAQLIVSFLNFLYYQSVLDQFYKGAAEGQSRFIIMVGFMVSGLRLTRWPTATRSMTTTGPRSFGSWTWISQKLSLRPGPRLKACPGVSALPVPERLTSRMIFNLEVSTGSNIVVPYKKIHHDICFQLELIS